MTFVKLPMFMQDAAQTAGAKQTTLLANQTIGSLEDVAVTIYSEAVATRRWVRVGAYRRAQHLTRKSHGASEGYQQGNMGETWSLGHMLRLMIQALHWWPGLSQVGAENDSPPDRSGSSISIEGPALNWCV